jgi:thiol:disulfide interchange protein DsbD
MHVHIARKGSGPFFPAAVAALLALTAAGAAIRAQEGLLTEPLLPGAEPVAQTGNFRVVARLEPVEQAAGGRVSAEIAFSCQPDHYVWHDSIKVTLASATAEGAAVAGIAAGALVLPQPKEKYDEFAGGAVKYLDGDFVARLPLHIAADARPGSYDLALDIRYTGCGPNVCQFGKASAALRLEVLPGPVPGAPGGTRGPVSAAPPPGPIAPDASSLFAGRSPFLAVVIAFLGGLGLTFTPCVYPLIPVTISLIGAAGAARKRDALVRALVYVFGISATYSVVGVTAAATGDLFGAWLQRPVVYLALAAVFVLLSGAMFDLYQVDVSSQRLYRLQAALRGRWGLLGIWLIGLVSGAAVTACIAPVISGALLYVAQSRNMVLGFLIFFAMAWGMGAPLVVLGTFAGLLRSLPRSGEWMVLVKRAFGLALLAVGVYYVGKSRILPQAWFGVLVAASLVGAGVWVHVISWRRGWPTWPARLGLLASIWLVSMGLLWFTWHWRPPGRSTTGPAQSIQWVASEKEALAAGRTEGKPVLLDFWADWCAPCRLMAGTTFVDERVVEESRRFVCAQVDVTDPSAPAVAAVLDQYGVRGVPTVVTISSAGELRMHTGYIGPDDMLRLLQSVR